MKVVVVVVGRPEGLFPWGLHQVRLGDLLQLGKDTTATPLGRAVHLEDLPTKEDRKQQSVETQNIFSFYAFSAIPDK